jgi:thiol-disulfide isomerase/thioredoxin
MAKKNKSKKGSKSWIIGVVVIVLIVVAIVLISKSGKNYSSSDVDAFAKCLTEKGAVMYGAFWCPHCSRVKKNFGESFRYINYVECDPKGENEQSTLCIQKGIENYATFEFNNNPETRLVGEPSFEELAAATGCPAPQAK